MRWYCVEMQMGRDSEPGVERGAEDGKVNPMRLSMLGEGPFFHEDGSSGRG